MSASLKSVANARSLLLEQVKKPQIQVFYVSAVLIGLTCFSQFEFLLTRYWFIEDWISKGPVIWLVSLFVIHRELSRKGFRDVTTNLNLAFTAGFVPLLVLGIYIDPLLAPTLLVVFAWYLSTSSVDLTRLVTVWLFLLFSLPFYSQLVPGLQTLTVIVTENLLGFLGIPIHVQEHYIAIPSGLFFVEEGCSGFNYMANNLLLLFLYSLMSRFGFGQFLLGLLVTVLFALIMNWIRVVLIILFAHNFGIEHSFVESHQDFGWFLYALFLVPYFYLMLQIDRKYRRQNDAKSMPARNLLSYPACILLTLPLLTVLCAQWLLGV